jgi:hypothetical protein
MRRVVRLVVAAFAALLATNGGSAWAGDRPHGGDVTCKGPFTNRDTGRELLERYKGDARVEPSQDITGEQFESLFLFPDDRHARLELEEQSGRGVGRLQAVNLYESSSLWTIGGLRLGMTLAQLEKAHGGPLMLSGIQQMSGTRFTILGSIPDGACEVVVVFDAPKDARFDHPLYNVEVRSDDPRLAPLNLRIDELSLIMPEAMDD